MAGLKWYDGAVLASANLWIALRHRALVAEYRTRRPDKPSFATPANLSQLVQWRKIFDHNPMFVVFCDELQARQWALATDPEIEVSELVWTGDKPGELPPEFNTPGYVIKASHGSAFNYFPDRKPVPGSKLQWRMKRWLTTDFGPRHNEWAYSQVRPALLVEKRIGDGDGLWEMTFRCHDGHVSAYYVAQDQKTDHEYGAFFSGNDQRLPPVIDVTGQLEFPCDFVPPPILAQAKAHAERLSRGIDYARADFICHDDHVYFCEMTVYVGSGFGIEDRVHIAPFIERAWLENIGLSWFLSATQPWPLSLYAASFRRWAAMRRVELA